MASGTSLSNAGVATRLPPILDLPLDLFLPIIEMLTVPELRLLGRANRSLRSFVTNHLSNTCYKSALFRLPNEALRKIATHLSPDPGGHVRVPMPSSFARTSQRFYPTLMEHTIQLAIERGTNYFLYQAVKFNDLRLAPKILRLGGDVQGNDSRRIRSHIFCCTPLEIAAEYGHEAMVRVLLDAGAGQGKGKARSALVEGLSRGYEDITLLLWAELMLHDAECTFRGGPNWLAHCSRSGETALLSLACQEGLISLSRVILQRLDTLQRPKERIQIRTFILLDILHRNAHWVGNNVHRPLPKNVHSIMKLLLEYGADPDMNLRNVDLYNKGWRTSWMKLPSGTIRGWASESPDYRVRDMMLGIESIHVEESENKMKTKSRRQATSNRPVNHHGKACKWRRKHHHQVLRK